ncbi:MAG: cyclic nucleotide-binding domain-containing protein [Candidatus Marinimicrobia bacterium]|nr:cyclic nucleotide-binding domain-containing protein [Candidatus Neomarinimicrobiota bacterium]
MKEIYFEPGSVIIKEGEISSTAYILKSGVVEVTKKTNSGEIKLAEIEAENIFGELGLIEDSPRTASVRAKTKVIVDEIKREDFSRILGDKSRFVIPIMKTLIERLRQTNELVAELEDKLRMDVKSISEKDIPTITIEGLTEESKKALRDKKIEIKKFPFKIGRDTRLRSKDIFIENDLYIEDKPPYNVSRNHMSINYLNGIFYVLDRGSSLGTIVNDKKIGGETNIYKTDLKEGENIITLGSIRSPFKFKITI